MRLFKTIFATVAVIGTLATSAQAASYVQSRSKKPARYGSKCGLVDFSGDNSIVDIGRGLRLNKASQLSALGRAQVIATARNYNGDAVAYGEDSVALLGAQQAIDYLNGGSEGAESYLRDFHIRGEVFTQVIFYPGGNPVGAIFEKGSSEILAEIQDSDIVCK